ncbi:hypothetical protein M2272_001354 [Mycobacterium frederiksbergense]|uniref:Immunity protein Imm33 domain-containing protein n=1 Tax=Mycolicibacterium frederiksbergense TaxID=117567 RepID=A0ABT6KXN2_9MYCO|nr:DUF2185 domain-containing protein [Mycolicibacterium frederiksbergense]MDH6194725.1 hypothetical protein [Mycolicibacterium frederiksbergense]
MAKKFWLPADRIVEGLAPDYGCFASDRIMVDGAPVGYMYRDGEGWTFLAGDEDQDYVDDPANLGLYSLNVVANYDRSIIDYLNAPPGSAFIREGSGFVEDLEGAPCDPDRGTPAQLNPDYPVLQDRVPISSEWSLTMPAPVNVRTENGSLVFWRPGFTACVTSWGDGAADETRGQRVQKLQRTASPDGFDHMWWTGDGIDYLTYRLAEHAADNRLPALYGFVVADIGHLQFSVYFDAPEQLGWAQALVASARPN